jgi:hypothetical protein
MSSKTKTFISTLISSALSVSGIFLALLIAMEIFWRLYIQLMPAGAWLDVQKVWVADSVRHECPAMKVERSINQPFLGIWRVELERKVFDLYAFEERARGENFYTTDAKLPDVLDLGWWSNGKFCVEDDEGRDIFLFEPGVYRIHTVWQVDAEHFPPKFVSVYSNDFKISD